jgi:thiol-disulfide isomerase/thioredoxin
MGKASRQKRQGTVRERIAAQQAAERRTAMRNKVLAWGAVAVVIVVVVVFVAINLTKKNQNASASSLPTGAALTKITSQATSVPPSTLDTVGSGTVQQPLTKLSGQPPLKKNGKPEMVYIGAEYCPFCAAERWAMTVALSRFGTFSNLGVTHSDTADVYPNTNTLSFYKSSYHSKDLVFTPVETTDPNKKTLQQPTAAQQALLSKYDAPPYVSSQSAGAIPFIDIGNKYLISGASYSPQVLQNKSWSQIAAALHDPSSPIAKGVDGTANMITAAICKSTGNKPSKVCTSKAVTSAEGKL